MGVEASQNWMEPFLWGGVYPLRHHVKILIWQLEEGLSWINGLKMRKEKFIFDEIIPAPYTF